MSAGPSPSRILRTDVLHLALWAVCPLSKVGNGAMGQGQAQGHLVRSLCEGSGPRQGHTGLKVLVINLYEDYTRVYTVTVL